MRKCSVIRCTNRVREGLRRSVSVDDGLADGERCAKCRKAERAAYVRKEKRKAGP